jgi:hypothetical protein
MLLHAQIAPEFRRGLLQRSTVILHPFWVDLEQLGPSYGLLKFVWNM